MMGKIDDYLRQTAVDVPHFAAIISVEGEIVVERDADQTLWPCSPSASSPAIRR